MADGLTIEMDDEAVIRAIAQYGAVAQPLLNGASLVTANAIKREADARLRRQLGPDATGQTASGLTVRKAYDGNGYILIAEREPFPNLPWWIEKGTEKGKPHSHKALPRPFFYVSALLEEGNHRRRIIEALQQAASTTGLGD